MTKSKKKLEGLPVPPPPVEFPSDPPLLSKKNRLPIREVKFVTSYLKQGVGSVAVVEAGYTTKNPAHKATSLLKRPRVKNALQPVIDGIAAARMDFVNAIQKRAKSADLMETELLLKGIDVLTKNHQLLTGNSTENLAVVDVTEAYNRLINDVKEGK